MIRAEPDLVFVWCHESPVYHWRGEEWSSRWGVGGISKCGQILYDSDDTHYAETGYPRPTLVAEVALGTRLCKHCATAVRRHD